ncbi:MAG: 30S ribosomal protein S19e [archaeon]|nr:30S ribosomal protein S19e [archaeon]
MTTVYDVPPDKLVRVVGEKLKKNKAISLPKWGINVKGMANKELPPQDKDWWWVRCASVLRQIYIHGPVGVARLRTRYGGRVGRGVKRERFREASGKIIREVLSQLERAGYVTKTKKGRKISPEGQKFLDTTARELEIMDESTKEE